MMKYRIPALLLCVMLALSAFAGAEESGITSAFFEAPIEEMAEIPLEDVDSPDAMAFDSSMTASDDEAGGMETEGMPATDASIPEPTADAEVILESNASSEIIAFEMTGNSSRRLNIGDVMQVAVKGKTIATCKSSSPKIASVTKTGLVTALKAGKAKITITTASKKKLKLTITVVDPYVPTSIALNVKKASVDLGQRLTLVATMQPATARSTLKWKSSKPKVATVDGNGIVTPVAEGKTKITVTTANKKRATATVTVVDPSKPASVSLNKTSAKLMVYETLQLSATLQPETAASALKWSSSDKSIAKVSANGLVTGTGQGTATITVKTANGKKATAKIKVSYGMNSSRYNYFRKYMSKSEFNKAYKEALKIVLPLKGLSREEQLYGAVDGIYQIWLDIYPDRYSTSTRHYKDPYGYFIEKRASCAGCCRALGFCLNILGISYEHVNESKWTHQWVRVKVGNTYWALDGNIRLCQPEPAPRQHPYL